MIRTTTYPPQTPRYDNGGFSSNGMLLVKQKEFNLFFDNANPQQQMLLSGLVEAISTTTKVRVLITKTNPNVCFSRQPIVGYDDNGNPTYGEKEQSFIYTQYNGGGATSRDPKFGYIIGICDKVANETLCSSELNIFGVPHNGYQCSIVGGEFERREENLPMVLLAQSRKTITHTAVG